MKKIFGFFGAILVVFSLSAQTDILVENFESGIPSSWTIIDNDHYTLDTSVANEYNNVWVTVKNPDNDSEYVASCASFFSPEGSTASRWLITPQLGLGNYGNYIHWKAKSQDPSYPDSYLLLISTSGNAVSDFTDTLYNGENTPPTWLNLNVSISDSGYNNQNVYLAFVDNSFYGYKLYIDSVRIEKESVANIHTYSPSSDSFVLYPNPAQNIVHIQSYSPIESVEIYDLSGKLLIRSKTEEINISTLVKGIYCVKVKSSVGSIVQKLIKE
jgi:hypothetical protein